MKAVLTYALLLLSFAAPPAEAGVMVVPVEKVIDGGLAEFVRRCVREAEEEKAEAIIFHVDTPGGRIDSAVDIKDTILGAETLTVAFVDKNAISAGSLISIACDSIYMATGSSIGAATAVDLQGKKASEKVISYFRAQMRAAAEANGRRTDIAEAMVDDEIEIENVTEKGKLLTLTYGEALELGISDGTADSIEEVLSLLGKEGTAVKWMKPNWAENVVRFLTHPVVSSLLMSIAFLGLIIEIKTPGWGIGGTLGLIALALFFGSHYIVHLAGLGELLLFGLGLVLLALEIFVIPGFGIAGISGIALIIISLYLSLIGRIPHYNDFSTAAYVLGGAILLSVAGTLLLVRALPGTIFYRKMVLETVESAEEGYASPGTNHDILGARGTALSDLRPSGKALIKGRRIDVVTEGDYIPKGSEIEVTEVHGARVLVRRV